MKMQRHFFVLALVVGLAAYRAKAQSNPAAPEAPLDAAAVAADIAEEQKLASLGGVGFAPVGGNVTVEEKAALLTAIDAYWAQPDREDFSKLEGFLTLRPNSPYAMAMEVNLGFLAYHYGYYSRALDYYEKAWTAAKAGGVPKDLSQQKIASDAGVKLAGLYARLGRRKELEQLLEDMKSYPLFGSNSARFERAMQSDAMMNHKPGIAYNCGPGALLNIAKSRPGWQIDQNVIRGAQATPDLGFSMADLEQLANKAGLRLLAAKRSAGAEIPLPAVVHWKAGHYAAILEQKNGMYHLKDPTFVTDFWISAQALNEESSGAFLIPSDDIKNLPMGWAPLGSAALRIYGKGTPESQSDLNQPSLEDDPDSGATCNAPPSPTAPWDQAADVGFDSFEAQAVVTDSVLAYSPPVGPSIQSKLSYYGGTLQAGKPGSLIGGSTTKWTLSWFATIQDTANQTTSTEYTDEGRILTYTAISSNTTPDETTRNIFSHATLVRVTSGNTTTGFQELFPDGSVREYMQKQSGNTTAPYFYLTKLNDAQGNFISFAYDGSDRLTTVTDAIGQNTTLGYTNGTFTNAVTYIKDPFSRTANLTYDASGNLISIKHAIGTYANFSYGNATLVNDVTTSVTPYGSTTIAWSTNATVFGQFDRQLLITDPKSEQDRVEYLNYFIDPGNGVTEYENVSLHHSKQAMAALGAGSLANDWIRNGAGNSTFNWQYGRMLEWKKEFEFAYGYSEVNAIALGVLHLVRRPLEGTESIFLGYDAYLSNPTGEEQDYVDPSGTQEPSVSDTTYNDYSNVLTMTDPLGRMTTYNYDTNGIDVLNITVGSDLVAQFSNYTNHRPGKSYDAAGYLTETDYSGNGKLQEVRRYGSVDESVLLAKTHYNRDANSYVSNITQMDSGGNMVATQSYGYIKGLVANVTDARGFTVSYGYDNLQRMTNATYSDGTTESWSYSANLSENLGGATTAGSSLGSHTDRLGHTTSYAYDAAGHETAEKDAAGRTISYDYSCSCGLLESITDGDGQVTSFTYDINGQILTKTLTTGSGNNTYSYGYQLYSGWLANTTIPYNGTANLTVNYAYNADQTKANITYAGLGAANPANVTFGYDTTYPRISNMTDGIGTSNYTYWPVGGAGANQLKEVDGPWGNDTLHYDYDGLGRVSGRKVLSDDGNTTFQSETYAYDSLSRLQTAGGDLGNFTLAYNGSTSQLTGMAYPNGLNTTLAYLPNNQGAWLQTLTNLAVGNASILSQGNYTHRGDGSIATWQENYMLDGNSSVTQQQLYSYTYDNSGWLTGANFGPANGNVTAPAAKDTWQNWTYTYDNAGNRLTASIAGNHTATTTATLTGNYNGANQLTALTRGAGTRIAGYTDEPANVTLSVGGGPGLKPRQWSLPGGKLWTFEAVENLAPGASNVTVVAKDQAGNSTTGIWTVQAGGTAANFTYDQNGAMVTRVDNPGTATNVTTNYTWDGLGRLTKIANVNPPVGGVSSVSFGYDGNGRRVQLTALTWNGTGNTTTNEYYIWAGDEIVQKRVGGSGSANLAEKYFERGFQLVSSGAVTGNYMYTKDHLGSIKEVAAGNGTVVGRYSYGPWGETVYEDLTGGNVAQPDFGYCGYFRTKYDPNDYYALNRVYRPDLARWPSRDPSGELGGLNLYDYAGNDPIGSCDPTGLATFKTRNLEAFMSKVGYWACTANVLPLSLAGNYNVDGEYHVQIFYSDNGSPSNQGYDPSVGVVEESPAKLKEYKTLWATYPYELDDATMRKAVKNLIDSGDWGPAPSILGVTSPYKTCQDFALAALHEFVRVSRKR